MRYATANNVTGKAFYAYPGCYLHPKAAEKLTEAAQLAAQLGLKIKIFDAFRPLEAQQFLWDNCPEPEFVSNPETGSVPHCRGVAVDLTLLDASGAELDMGTEFDDFSPRAFHGNTEISPEAQRNRLLLIGIMTTAGWDFFRNEWWHYQLFEPRTYPKLTDAAAGTGLIVQ